MSEESSSTWMSPVSLTDEQRKELLRKEVFDYSNSHNLNPLISSILSGKLPVDEFNPQGYAAIHLAVWERNQDYILKLLDKAGCPVDLRSKTGRTPLMLAALDGNIPTINLLLERGCNIESKDDSGMTPLLAAVQRGQVSSFYTLLNRGAQLEVVDKNAWTAVHWAAYKNQTLMLRILKHLGLDLHKKDDLGMTPLHRATLTNSYSAAKYLMLNGADPYAQDSKQRDVFSLAYESKAAAVRQLLSDHGNEYNPIITFFTYLFLAFWVGTYYCYYSCVLEFTSFKLGLSLSFNFCYMWLLPLFLVCKFMDCAHIRTARIDPDSAATSSELTTKDYENLEFFDSVCYTCGIFRPNRSRHCRFTDRCVLDYDHYCYFLHKPIGKGNRKVFFFGLLVNFLAVWLFLVICWSMVDDRVPASGYLSTYVVRLVKEYWKLQSELKVCLLLSSCVAWYNLWYLVLVVYSVANGLTVNEVVNRHRCRYLYEAYVSADDTIKMRFRNPFTKGALNNFLDFLIN